MAAKAPKQAGKNGKVVDTVREAIRVPERPTTAVVEPVRDTDKLVSEAVAIPDTLVDFSWFTIAKRELGQREQPGLKHNPRILEYHATTTLKGTTDEIPWCSSFVNWCMQQAGYTGTRSAAARSWTQWGQRLAAPVPGCIVVLTRDGGGHVGFYVGQDAKNIRVLGGNQSDTVNIASYDRKRLLAYVVPKNLKPTDNEILYRRLAENV